MIFDLQSYHHFTALPTRLSSLNRYKRAFNLFQTPIARYLLATIRLPYLWDNRIPKRNLWLPSRVVAPAFEFLHLFLELLLSIWFYLNCVRAPPR